MAEQNIKKLYRNRVGMEDITLGTGTETQTRNGQAVQIKQVNASLFPFDETKTLAETYDDIKLAEENTNTDKLAIDARLDLAQTNGNTVEENLDIITSEPIATQLANAETNANNSNLQAWESEARAMTSNSYATEAENVFVKLYTSNGDGTFSSTNSTEYSAFHWKEKSAEASSGIAENIAFDNTASDLVATQVQEALEELEDTRYTKTEADVITTANTDLINSVDAGSISTVTSNVLINQESLALELFTILKGFATVTYTGNGTTQDIVTGISSVDFTVSSNGSGYWLDRTTNEVKDDAGVVQASGEVVVNTSKIHIKSRSIVASNTIVDGLRGEAWIHTDLTNAEGSGVGIVAKPSGVNSFTVYSNSVVNQDLATYVAYQELYTHIKWGATSQGKFQIESYNPISGMGMIYYIGSGVVGHEISHSQDVELDYCDIKRLSDISEWTSTSFKTNDRLLLNDTDAGVNDGYVWDSTDSYLKSGTVGTSTNSLNAEYIMYYKRKSLNWTIGTYQGIGVTGNFIETKDVNGDARQPRRVIIKAVSTTGNWLLIDTERGEDQDLYLNLSNIETSFNTLDISSNGFTLVDSSVYDRNVSGVQYIYIVEFDSNSDGGDGYFNNPTDDSNLIATNSDFTYTLGKDEKGLIRGSERYNGSIDFTTANDGINWIGKKYGLNEFRFEENKPNNGLYSKENAEDNRIVYLDGKQYETTGDELVTNGTFDTDTSGWTAGDSASLSVANGVLSVYNNSPYGDAYQLLTGLEIGATYSASFSIVSVVGGDVFFQIETTLGLYDVHNDAYGVGTYIIEFVAPSASLYINLQSPSLAGNSSQWDNISIYKKEATLGAEVTEPLSFSKEPYMVTSGTPQEARPDIDELSTNVTDSLEVTALAVTDVFNLKQEWVDVVSERAGGIIYINDTGKPIVVSVAVQTASNIAHFTYVDNVRVGHFYDAYDSIKGTGTLTFTVPNMSVYKISNSGNQGAIKMWVELR